MPELYMPLEVFGCKQRNDVVYYQIKTKYLLLTTYVTSDGWKGRSPQVTVFRGSILDFTFQKFPRQYTFTAYLSKSWH